MTLQEGQLGSFGLLARALGIVDESGSANTQWFADPVGSGANPHGLRHVLGDDGQREALVAFVDEVLGPPERAMRHGAAWVPLFRETTPNVTIFAVVEPVGDEAQADAARAVHLGVAIEHTTEGMPRVATRVHVPLFQLSRAGATLPESGGALPDWLLVGRRGGRVEVTVDATFREGAPAAGEPSLGGLALTLGVPTTSDDDLSVELDLRDLQLPGASAPQSFPLNAERLDQLDEQVFQLLVGLVRAQAAALDASDAAVRPFAALTGLLGLREVPGVPALPLAELPTHGVDVLVEWIEGVLADGAARDAWLGEIAALFAEPPFNARVEAARDAVVFELGVAHVSVGVRVEPGTSARPVLTPWVEVALSTRAGADVRLAADLLRAETATGAVAAFPDLRAEAVFGADATGGSALLTGDPALGSVRLGVKRSATGQPAFFLTLHDARLLGRDHTVLDLSSPDAVLDSVDSVVAGALTDALAELGLAGTLVGQLIGVNPPTGVSVIEASAVLADPLQAIGGYWDTLLTTPGAMPQVLGSLRQLLLGGVAELVPGSGTLEAPWRIDFAEGVGLRLHRDAATEELVVALGAEVRTPVLGEFTARAALEATLVRVAFAPLGVRFAVDAQGSLRLRRTDERTARLDLHDLALTLDWIALAAGWSAVEGLRVELEAERLALEIQRPRLSSVRVGLPLPRLGADGRFHVPSPNWSEIEAGLAALLGALELPVVDAATGLLGWSGRGARLPLEGLFGGDPGAAIETWLTDLLLDCETLRLGLGPVAALLSGFSTSQPLGIGSLAAPLRCPVAGLPSAPALAAWLVPGCAPRAPDVVRPLAELSSEVAPLPEAVVAALELAGRGLPELNDLLVGRSSLAEGLSLLIGRWANTDGVVGAPDTLDGVEPAVVLPDRSYAQLVALGGSAALLDELFETAPSALVYVGCEASWTSERPAGSAFDLTSTSTATLPSTGAGTWFVRLPTVAEAAAARPERGGVAEQAARLEQLLAGRSEPVTLVAFGASGAAALRAAAALSAVEQVVTVGVPWREPSVDALRAGTSGDALLLLRRLLGEEGEAWPAELFALQASPREIVRELVRRSLAVAADVSALPSAHAEPRRSGLRVRPVFGALSAEMLSVGVAALVDAGVAARVEAAQASAAVEGPHQSLHLGVDLPALELDLGGLLLSVGATLEACAIERAESGGVRASGARGVVFHVQLAVRDGWLVGGPGAASRDVEVRWLAAHASVPFDGRAGTAELVLHEARAFTAERERWVVRADAAELADAAATVALPEVKIILSSVVARLRATSTPLGSLLEQIGLVRDGGLDPDALDRLLHDPVTTVRAARSAAVGIAGSLRSLIPAAIGAGSIVEWSLGPASVQLDLAARTAAVGATLSEAGLPPIEVTLALAPSTTSFELALGTLDPHAGGLRLVGRAGSLNTLVVEWQAPAGPVQTLRLLPVPTAGEVGDLEALVSVLLPATLAQAVASFCRSRLPESARGAFEAAFDALGLLGVADERGWRALRLPLGLFQDPGAWLLQGVAGFRANPAGSAVALLDALRPIVAPEAESGQWPLSDELRLTYYADTEGALCVALEVTLATELEERPVVTNLSAGVKLRSGTAHPLLGATFTIDGRGLRLTVDDGVRLLLVRPSASPIELYPSGPGLGGALAAAGETVLPPLLNALIERRSDSGDALVRDVARAVFELSRALDLLEGDGFTAARLAAFAADPAARLLARLPAVVTQAAATLAQSLDPTEALVHVTGPSDGRVTLRFGAADGLTLTLDGQGALPAVELGASVTLPGIGAVALERLRISARGVQVAARLGPGTVQAGALALHPVVVVQAGVSDGDFTRLVGLGLAIDATDTQTVQFRWSLDERPPTLVVTRAGESPDDRPEQVAIALLSQAASLAVGVLAEELGPILTPLARNLLRGVVFRDEPDSVALDPQLFFQLFQAPEQLLGRLQRLLWNAADESLSVTIDDTVTIGLVGEGPAAGPKQLGLRLSLPPGRRFELASGDPSVELEVDANWIEPTKPAGLSLYVLEGRSTGDTYSFEFQPGVLVAGVGLRFANSSGPLLDLGGVSLDAIGVHVYGEATSLGVGGGVRLELEGFAVAPSGSGGDNAVASGIMNDASASGAANRPSFSPSLAVQLHPGQSSPSVSLRAGDPPGPWWIVVQRQLGPLYLERVGLDTTESNGQLVRIALLFDGRVSLFGLTAEVDQLSISWLGGDVFDLQSWAVDLQGLAVSADLSGLSLSGGLLKTTQNNQISYVGMLMGRFGTYGLSVFGGYTDDAGSPSFFVFGALNGPIGGPPAFFVTGIGGGLGINRGLRVPEDLSRFGEYPFITALDPAAAPREPMTQLRELNGYFPVARGQFWFAAGISFTCFSLVDGIAVLSVAFGDGLDINLFGLARMALPRPGAALVSIELGLLARFSTREGLFSIRAQLTDNSWLLYEDVRLTGGFAFVVWWKGPNRGQFVLTLGGYHPSFQREGYPDVPRLGLVWQVTDQIVIKGGSYFALTSEALMAGVEVEVSADFGWAWARIAFGANAIVYFDPFWFEADAYARIAAGVEIDTFFGTIRFGISLGAEIRVWGPEFSGEATFNVGPASVTVSFGSERAIPKRVLEWTDFVGKYLEATGSSARAISAITGRGTLPASTGGQTGAPTADGSAARPFEVFAEFELTVTTTIPALSLVLPGAPERALAVTRSDGALAAIGMAPMNATLHRSALALTLRRLSGSVWTEVPTEFAKLTAHLNGATPGAEGSPLGTEAFPLGVWGAPQPDDPSKAPLPRGDVLFAGNRVRLVAEADALHRGPEIDYYRVEAERRPLPLQAQGGSRPELMTRASEVEAELPRPATPQAALLAARRELFDRSALPEVPQVLPRGPRSNLARASFAGERAAPPLFGTLADGLIAGNAADRTALPQPPRPVPAHPGPRLPKVVALMTAGTGVPERAERTTVANARTKRRRAPSLSSVQARLSRTLPIQLKITALPSTVRDGTVIASGVVPRTNVPGTVGSYVAGRGGGFRALESWLAGPARSPTGAPAARSPAGTAAARSPAGALRPATPQRLGPGDLLLLRLPDAAIDVAVDARPALELDGTARVTLLHGNGAVALDSVTRGRVNVPPGVALIAVQAGTPEAGVSAADTGMDGWHASARLAALSSRAALGAGCVLSVDVPGAGSGVGWTTGAELVAHAATVSTRFVQPVRTVAIALADADPEHLDRLQLQLLGASRALRADGSPRPPLVVLRGSEAVLLYAIQPSRTQPVVVHVSAGGTWRLNGVLGGYEAVDTLAELIRERHLGRLARRVLMNRGEGCAVRWSPAAAPSNALSETGGNTAHGRR